MTEISDSLGQKISLQYSQAGDFLHQRYKWPDKNRYLNSWPVCTEMVYEEKPSNIRIKTGFWYEKPFRGKGVDANSVQGFQEIFRFDNMGIITQTSRVTPELINAVNTYFDPYVKSVFEKDFPRSSNGINIFEDVVKPYKERDSESGVPKFLSKAKLVKSENFKYRNFSNFSAVRVIRPQKISVNHYDLKNTDSKMSISTQYRYSPCGFLTLEASGPLRKEFVFLEDDRFTGLIAEEKWKRNNGKMIHQVKHYYDNKDWKKVGHQGNITKVETVVMAADGGSEQRAYSNEFVYGKWGNILLQKKNLGKKPTLYIRNKFDRTDLFLEIETMEDPNDKKVRLTRNYMYDFVSHKRTTTINQAGKVSETEYDAIGRVKAEYIKRSVNSSKYILKKVSYDFQDNLVVVEEDLFNLDALPNKSDNTIPKWRRRTFLTSSGRFLQTKEWHPDHPQHILCPETNIYDYSGKIKSIIKSFSTGIKNYEPISEENNLKSNIYGTFFEYNEIGDLIRETGRDFPSTLNKTIMVYMRTQYDQRIQGKYLHYFIRSYPDPNLKDYREEKKVFSPNGLLISTQDSVMRKTVMFSYDPLGNIQSIQRGKLLYHFRRDSEGKLLKTIDPEYGETRLDLDGYGQTIQVQVRNIVQPGLENRLTNVERILAEVDEVFALSISQLLTILSGPKTRDKLKHDLTQFFSEWATVLGSSREVIDQLFNYLAGNKQALIRLLPKEGISKDNFSNFYERILRIGEGKKIFLILYSLLKSNHIIKREHDFLGRVKQEKYYLPIVKNKGANRTHSRVVDSKSTVSYLYDYYGEEGSEISADLRGNELGLLTSIKSRSRTTVIGYDWFGRECRRIILGQHGVRASQIKQCDLSGNVHELLLNETHGFSFIYDKNHALEKLICKEKNKVSCTLELNRSKNLDPKFMSLSNKSINRKKIQSFNFNEQLGFQDSTNIKSLYRDHTSPLDKDYQQEIQIDSLGRINSLKQDFGGKTYSASFIHDLIDRLTQVQEKKDKGIFLGDDIQINRTRNRYYDRYNNLNSVVHVDNLQNTKQTLKQFYYSRNSEVPHTLTKGSLGDKKFVVSSNIRGSLTDVKFSGSEAFSFHYNTQGVLAKISKGPESFELNYDAIGNLQELSISDGTHIEYFDEFALYDHQRKTWCFHISFENLTLISKIAPTNELPQYIRHSLDCRVDLVTSEIITGVGSEYVSPRIMGYSISEDLKIDVFDPFIPLHYLPRIARGGWLLEFQGLQVLRFGTRFYLPSLEIFTSIDPYLPAPLFYNAFNRYRFAFNNTLNMVDRSGNNPIALLWGAVAIFAIVGGIYGAQRWGWKGAIGGAIVGGAIGAVVGAAGYFTASAIIAATQTTAGYSALGYGIGQALITGTLGGVKASLRDKNILSGIAKGAVVGFVAGAFTGTAEASGILSRNGFLYSFTGSTVSSGLESAFEGGSIIQGIFLGAIVTMASYAFSANSAFAEEYDSNRYGGALVGRNENFAGSSVPNEMSLGDLAFMWVKGTFVTNYTRAMVIGGAIGGLVYWKTKSIGWTAGVFLGTTALGTAILMEYSLDGRRNPFFYNEPAVYKPVRFNNFSLGIGSAQSWTGDIAMPVGLFPLFGGPFGSIYYFRRLPK